MGSGGGTAAVDTLDRPHPLDCLGHPDVILDELEEACRRQQSHGQQESLCDWRQHLAKHYWSDVIGDDALQAAVEWWSGMGGHLISREFVHMSLLNEASAHSPLPGH